MTEEVVDQSEVNEVEARATELGWMPKEAWIEAGKDPAMHRSAELFIELEPLFGKIDSLKREVRTTKQTLEQFKQHHQRVAEVEYKRALEDLKAQKIEALQDGDAERVVELDDKIARKVVEEAEAKKQAAAEQAGAIHPEFAEWVAHNQWYTADREMQAFADSIGNAYAIANPGVQPAEVLKHVERKVKQAFSEKFKNPAQSRPSPVEGVKAPAKSNGPAFELSEEERRVMNRLVKSGVMSEADYIRDLKKVKG